MNEERLRHALRGDEAPDPAARERAWRVVRAAYRASEPADRRRRRRPMLAVAAVILAILVAAFSTSAPSDAEARWVQDVLRVGEPGARPALSSVPGGGRLLVASGPGV